MTLLTQAGFAELHDVSKKTVTVWKTKGYLVFDGKKVDVEASDAVLEGFGLGRFKAQKGNDKGNSAPTSKGNAITNFNLDDATAQAESMINEVLKGALASKGEAERIKENALALKHVMHNQVQAGKLIDLEKAEQIIFAAFRSIRDSWMNWPARVGALVAADLGLEADRVTEVLTNHVQEHLGELGEPDADLRREG